MVFNILSAKFQIIKRMVKRFSLAVADRAFTYQSSIMLIHGEVPCVETALTVSRYGTSSKCIPFHSDFIFSIAFSKEYSFVAAPLISSNLRTKKDAFKYLIT